MVERQPRRPPAGPAARHVELIGFGAVAYGTWLAHDTFSAVFGNSQAPMFGGGVQVRVGSLFVQGAVDYFQKTGSRVVVNAGTVFNLGIPDTVRVLPIVATIGYRHTGRQLTPYIGGGVGMHLYKETSDFADASENLSGQFASYHALAGVEFGGYRLLRVALEGEYTTVPHALGTTGASAAFNERDLGGIRGRVKVLVGR